jgi:hypothetical protein
MAKFNYFYIDEESTQVNNLTIKYPIARPTGSGTVDVHGTLRWKNSGNVEEVPRLVLTEYSLDYGAWTSNLARILTGSAQLQQGQLDPYQALYTGNKTGFYYSLPYLIRPGNSIRGNISNSWTDSTQGITDMAKSVLGGGSSKKAFDMLTGAGDVLGKILTPGYGTEPVKSFATTSENTISVSFPLYNTGSIEDANNNFSFVSLLAFQNLKTRTTFLSYLPPKIYSVDGLSDGSVYMPAAIIKELNIESIGTTRSITDLGGNSSSDGRTLIPEAYKVSIVFQELLPQSSNIMWGALGGQKVRVIAPGLANNPYIGAPQGGANDVTRVLRTA